MTKKDAKILANYLRVKRESIALVGLEGKLNDFNLSFLKNTSIIILHIGDHYYVEIQ